MNIIYHLCPADYYNSFPTHQPYVPADFEREGFIHCTRGAEQVTVVANRYYQNDPRLLFLFTIDEDRVTATLKNEPAVADGLLYPHIYGPLNRDAILSIISLPRLPDGSFQLPKRDQTRS